MRLVVLVVVLLAVWSVSAQTVKTARRTTDAAEAQETVPGTQLRADLYNKFLWRSISSHTTQRQAKLAEKEEHRRQKLELQAKKLAEKEALKAQKRDALERLVQGEPIVLTPEEEVKYQTFLAAQQEVVRQLKVSKSIGYPVVPEPANLTAEEEGLFQRFQAKYEQERASLKLTKLRNKEVFLSAKLAARDAKLAEKQVKGKKQKKLK